MTDTDFADLVTRMTVKRVELDAHSLPLFTPIVYMALSKTAVLYIGMSSKGIGRVFCRGHHVLSQIQNEIVKIEVYETLTEGDARILESKMIQEFRPKYNERQYVKRVRQDGRSSVAQIIAAAGY